MRIITAREIKARLEAFCEGMDDLVEQAPDLDAETAERLVVEWLTAPSEQKESLADTLIFAFTKALRSGCFDQVDIH